MPPVTEQWEDVLSTRFALGGSHPAVRAVAAFSAESGFFATAGREDEDGRQFFGGAAGQGDRHWESDTADAPVRAEMAALWRAGEETGRPPTLRLAGVVWHREELDRITDAVTGTELDLTLLRNGNRVMWAARTGHGICILVLVDGDNEGHAAEARSLALDFDSFLVGQGY
ncbi:hypothetical protein [Streptomyces poriferorum]|uniref:Uncharacterized protein n=1 Tax=Streptomyces poriferorum TaxID=2798799 RepID=A0ABY9J513_9ACTN|nr:MULTISPECIES: hypothetical protein [unclassified Streptomyces]MDP5309489.1 hypothetical protein [Streptomyces sp. Alt4]WLQ61318.1 hypothetical protein P8A19_40440 [Streptomyces sp. Alt2]